MKGKVRILAVALIIIVLGSLLSYGIDTSFGTVKTQRLQLIDDDGYNVSANLYVPDSASVAPAPAMIICPGGDCPSDIASPWATELARRGYVVAVVDYSGCGDTEVNPAQQYWTNNGSMELDTIYDYLATLAFVDSDQIGVGGHSMGSLYSYRLSTKRPVSLVISDVIYNDALPEYDFNFVQISAEHDEGILARLTDFDEIYQDEFLTAVFGTDIIEPNKLYGSWEDRTARIFYPLNQTHQDDMISGPFIRLEVQSVMNSMEAPNPISENDLIYGWKVVGLAAAIIGLVMFLFSLAGILLDSSLFSSLKLKAEQAPAGFAYKSKGWWICALILTLIPLAFFFPGTAVGNKLSSNRLFQLGTTPNGYVVWTLFSAVGLLVFFLIYHFKFGKKQGGSLSTYGFSCADNENRFQLSYLVKSAVFAGILFMSAYFILLLIYRYANTDLHIWTLSIRPFSPQRAAALPWYFLVLLPYFSLFLLAGNCLKFKDDITQGKGLVKSVLIGTIVGLVGMTALFVVYQVILRFDKPFYTGHFAHFYMDLLSNVIPQFGVATALALYIRRKTNSFYAGIMIGAAIIAFCMVSTNCLAMMIS
ncbi:alpha/beta fold hydrolase [Lachnospiraceae bacterium ASD3451]|uniref:alpha/beta hydrolase n=1 Tax=Diplocloster agilis TaxID=2850323 RepID=UPI001DFB5825|nr:alpha/beta fold hydrolase [Diplocloster agilis]MBU9743392.1 alpha/beta fold hydrolase [Diplocloster agilis]